MLFRSGASFGFPAISEIGAIIQTTAEADDPNGARAEIALLAAFLDSNPPIPDRTQS